MFEKKQAHERMEQEIAAKKVALEQAEAKHKEAEVRHSHPSEDDILSAQIQLRLDADHLSPCPPSPPSPSFGPLTHLHHHYRSLVLPIRPSDSPSLTLSGTLLLSVPQVSDSSSRAPSPNTDRVSSLPTLLLTFRCNDFPPYF